MPGKPAPVPFTALLSDVIRTDTLDFRHAWVGMEPTFSNKKTLKLWRKNAATEESELTFFDHPYVLGMEKAVAQAMRKKYRAAQKKGADWCLFDEVERKRDLDQWGGAATELALPLPRRRPRVHRALRARSRDL